jgi:hypothetical protein
VSRFLQFKADADASARDWTAALNEMLVALGEAVDTAPAVDNVGACESTCLQEIRHVKGGAAHRHTSSDNVLEPAEATKQAEGTAANPPVQTERPDPPPLEQRRSRRWKFRSAPKPPSDKEKPVPPPPGKTVSPKDSNQTEVASGAVSRWDFED